MFFIMGINEGRKELNFHQMVICPGCGAYGHYQVFMTYMCLSLFFIPCFKWRRRYFVQSSCCSSLWEIPAETGRAIARGESVELRAEDMTSVYAARASVRRCASCGFETAEDFDYCPKCGRRF